MKFIVNLNKNDADKLVNYLSDRLSFDIKCEENQEDRYLNKHYKNILIFDDSDYTVDLTIFIIPSLSKNKLFTFQDLIMYYYV